VSNPLFLTTLLHEWRMLGTHFTCFTGTKVQILTQKRYAGVDHVGWKHDKHIERLLLSKTISSAAKSLTHIVGVMIDRCELALLRQYLSFWYKSKHTDAEAVQKYKY
jgi:hypothetical protein